MPFSLSTDGAPPRPLPLLKVTDDKRFHLETEFYFVLPAFANQDFDASTNTQTHGTNANGDHYIKVVKGSTDLASVPPVLWGLMASYGKQTLPALLHDQLCDAASHKKATGKRDEAFEDRRHADNLFRHALRDLEVDWFRRWTFWAGVTFGRYAKFNWFVAAILGLFALAFSALWYLGLACLVYAGLLQIGAVDDPAFGLKGSSGELASLGVAAIAVGGVLSFLFMRHRVWALLLVAMYVGLPVLVLLVLGYVVLIWTRHVPWAIQKLLDTLIPPLNLHPGPMPPFSPTGLRLF